MSDVWYAAYRGDELVGFGTAAECALSAGVRTSTIKRYSTPSGRKRSAERCRPEKCFAVVRLDGDK